MPTFPTLYLFSHGSSAEDIDAFKQLSGALTGITGNFFSLFMLHVLHNLAQGTATSSQNLAQS